MSDNELKNDNDGQSSLTDWLGLTDYLRETWPLRTEFGEITTKQRRAIYEAADEIDRLRSALKEISAGVYSAPERLREIAALALKMPNNESNRLAVNEHNEGKKNG